MMLLFEKLKARFIGGKDPALTATDEQLLRELIDMPHFEVIKKLAERRMDEHMQDAASQRKLEPFDRIDELSTFIQDLELHASR